MAVSYNKLWKILVDKKMSKSDLRKKAEIAPNTMTKLRRDHLDDYAVKQVKKFTQGETVLTSVNLLHNLFVQVTKCGRKQYNSWGIRRLRKRWLTLLSVSDMMQVTTCKAGRNYV